MTPSAFRSTRWTLVRRAKGRDEESRAALSELCEIYYEPVLRFIAHRHPDQARDLTHGFFEQQLSRENLGDPDPTISCVATSQNLTPSGDVRAKRSSSRIPAGSAISHLTHVEHSRLHEVPFDDRTLRLDRNHPCDVRDRERHVGLQHVPEHVEVLQ